MAFEIPIIDDLLDGLGLSENEEATERTKNEVKWLKGLIPDDIYKLSDLRVQPESQDQGAIDSQRAALAQLSQMAQGRYSDIERARQAEMQRRNALEERGSREAAVQQAQARGMGRSGTALMGALGASQAAADRNSAETMQLEAMAQNRSLGALGLQGSLASQMRQAQDEIAKFNASAADRRWGMKRDKYDMATNAAALKLGQYSSQDAARAQGQQNLLGFAGELVA